MTLRRVDLPSPLRPVTQARAPGSTERVMFSRTGALPKPTVTSCRVTSAIARALYHSAPVRRQGFAEGSALPFPDGAFWGKRKKGPRRGPGAFGARVFASQ